MKNNRPVRFLIYSIYLAMTCSGLVFLAAGLRGEAPWAGCGMLLASCALGYAVSGFVKKYTAVAAVAAMLLAAAGTLLLLPYHGWNVVLMLINLACVIFGARHNWGEADTHLIDVRCMTAGLLISAIAYFVSILNGCPAPQPQIGYMLYAYIVLTVLLVNRKSVQVNAGGQAQRMMRSNQVLAWGFIAVFTLVVFFQPLQQAVGDAVRWIITSILEIFNKPVDYGNAAAGGQEGMGEMDLSFLGGDEKEWPRWLKIVSDVFLHAVTAVVLLALLAGLAYLMYKALKSLSLYLKDWFSSFGASYGEEYSEESEQLMNAQSMRKQFQEDVAKRFKKIFERPVRWSALTPNERVRHIYTKLLEQEKRITLSAENLTPEELCAKAEKDAQFAALYGKVRYAEADAAAEEVEPYRGYLKN